MAYRFLDLELCPQSHQLRRDSEPLALRSGAVDVLEHLIRNRHRVVSKLELVRRLEATGMSDDSLSRHVLALRRACRQQKHARVAIETHCGHGYRFVAELTQVDSEDGPVAVSEAAIPARSDPSEVFVGRESELDRLGQSLDAVTTSGGRCVFVEGGDGMGKSALARALADRASLLGIETLYGRCESHCGRPAYEPLRQVLAQWVERAQAEDAHHRLPPFALQLLGLAPPRPDAPHHDELRGDADATRLEAFRALRAAIGVASGGKPLIIVIDDLHRVEPSSLAFLDFLAGELADLPLLLVVTIAEAEAPASLAGLRATFERHGVLRSMRLGGLEPRDTERMIEALTFTRPHPRILEAIQEQTGGVPLYLGEVVSLLATDGRLEVTPELATWQLGTPASIRLVIADRVARVGRSAREALRLASVLGSSFDIAGVRDLADDLSLPVLTALEDAADAGVVEDRDVDQYAFGHELIRDALYQTLDADRRRALHLRAAERMIDLDLEVESSAIARHLLTALPLGDADRTIDYTLRAAEEARALHAPERAAELYREALTVLDDFHPADEDRRLDLLLALTRVARPNGAVLDEARLLAERIGRLADLRHAMRHAKSSSQSIPVD